MSRNLLTAGALAIGALGLVGIGAGASFTDDVAATQKVQTGTVDLAVTSATGSVVGDQLTCSTTSNQPSSGSATCDVVLTNTGSLPLQKVLASFDAGAAGDIAGSKITVAVDGKSLGTLDALRSGSAQALTGVSATSPLAAGASLNADITLTWNGLNNEDAGKAITNAMTFSAADM